MKATYYKNIFTHTLFKTPKGQTMRKIIYAFSLFLTLTCLLSACGDETQTTPSAVNIKRPEIQSEELQFTTPEDGDTIAIFATSLGEISAVLYPEHAPQACENFIALANEGFFDETTFSRVASEFCVQGGFATDGTAHTIWNDNPYPIETTDVLHHYAGALCAPVNENGLASSPFYFMQSLPEAVPESTLTELETLGVRAEVIEAYKTVGGEPYLDYTDTVFGQVYDGMDIVDAISGVAVDEDEKPLEDVILHSVTIETYSAN